MTIEMVTNDKFKISQRRTVLLSDCDEDLAGMPWTVIGNGYAWNRHMGYLHQVILSRMLGRSLVKGEKVDHWNRNKQDNQRENIRLANSSQNSINRGLQSNNTSGYRGVYALSEKVWVAKLYIHGKSKYLGYFHTPEEAAAAYDKVAQEAQGKFYVGNLE